MKMGWRSNSRSDISAFIGAATEFTGDLNFEGVIRLDGRFSGNIKSNGTLIIGDTALVKAEIEVDTVVISGEVHGNIRAKNRVQLHAPGKHYGDILSPIVTIDEGVIFEGKCLMKAPGTVPAKDKENQKKRVTVISKDGEAQVGSEII